MAKTLKQLLEEISNSDEYIKVNIKLQEELIKEYDKEIRKPLEEEIERLKKELDLKDKAHFENALKQLREIDYESVKKPLEDEIERLCRLCDKLNNDYLKQKEISDYGMKELNIAIRQLKQERQEVIAELEEFVCRNSKTRIISAYDDESEYDTERHINFQALRQKLNEMKGEDYES